MCGVCGDVCFCVVHETMEGSIRVFLFCERTKLF